MHKTWNEIKQEVDDFLEKEGRTGDIIVAHIGISSAATGKVYMEVSNKGRGPEEGLQVWTPK